MNSPNKRVQKNDGKTAAVSQVKSNARHRAGAPARLLFLDGLTGEQFADLELNSAEMHALILGSVASGLTVAQLIKVAIDEKIAAAKWAGNGKAPATDLASLAAQFMLKRPAGNHAPGRGESLPRSIVCLAEALEFSAREGYLLAAILEWEGESAIEYCRDAMRAVMEASCDGVEFFALREHGRPKERAWARKHYRQIAEFSGRRRPAANLKPQTGGVR